MANKFMEKEITKSEEGFEMLKKRMRFYLNTPEKFAEALTIIKQYEDFFAEMKESVKERGKEIMDRRDLKEIEFGNFVVRRIDPTETNEWSALSLIKVMGENAASFLKVSGGVFEKYLMKAKIPMDDIMKMKAGMKVKLKKGYIKLDPKREKKEKDGPVYIKE